MYLPNDHSSPYLRLRQAVNDSSGLTITAPADCALLGELVLIRIRVALSVTTLQRFYGFEPAKFPPSLFTLNALALYCGYKSWTDFCKQ